MHTLLGMSLSISPAAREGQLGAGAGLTAQICVSQQMQGPELVPGAPTQRIFQPPHTPQQNPLSYFLHPQQQSHHAQGQPCNLPDLPEMQLP